LFGTKVAVASGKNIYLKTSNNGAVVIDKLEAVNLEIHTTTYDPVLPATTGTIIYNEDSHKLWINEDGTTWKSITLISQYLTPPIGP
jgi:hypothetical protein